MGELFNKNRGLIMLISIFFFIIIIEGYVLSALFYYDLFGRLLFGF